MEKSILKNYYRPMLEQNSFCPIPCPEKFGPAGQCWELDPAVGSGYYWVYAKRDLFDIKIHDFCFHQDFCMEMDIPECISIQRYDSISGEELNPTGGSRPGTFRPSWGAIRATGPSSTSASPSTPWGWKFCLPIMRIF